MTSNAKLYLIWLGEKTLDFIIAFCSIFSILIVGCGILATYIGLQWEATMLPEVTMILLVASIVGAMVIIFED